MKSVWQLKFPETASSRYIKKIEPQIHEEITHMHPNYYFSKPQRHHRYLWFAGQTLRYTCVVVHEVINTTHVYLNSAMGLLRPPWHH